MSLLSHNEIRIFIGPQQVDLVHISGRGKRQTRDTRVLPVPASAPDETPWQKALATVDELMNEFRRSKADITLVLSNHFVRYVLIQHSAEIHSSDEQQALIRHYFANTYGPIADKWEFRLSDAGNNDDYQVASAVNPELTNALRAQFQQSNMVIRSIQPHLMAAFNSVRRDIGVNAWFALVEPGMLCLARLDHGQWRFLRTFNSQDDWHGDLTINLLRAKVLMNEDSNRFAAEVPVYVYAPGHSDIPWISMEQQTSDLFGINPMRLLRPAHLPSDASSTQPLFAMALTG